MLKKIIFLLFLHVQLFSQNNSHIELGIMGGFPTLVNKMDNTKLAGTYGIQYYGAGLGYFQAIKNYVQLGIGINYNNFKYGFSGDYSKWLIEQDANGVYHRDPKLDDAIERKYSNFEIPLKARFIYSKLRLAPYVEFGAGYGNHLIQDGRKKEYNTWYKNTNGQSGSYTFFNFGVGVYYHHLKKGYFNAVLLYQFYNHFLGADDISYANNFTYKTLRIPTIMIAYVVNLPLLHKNVLHKSILKKE